MKTDKVKTDERFNSLYTEFYSAVYKYCLARLKCNKDYTDDCVQDTFLVLYNKLLNGEHIENPRAFLYTVATNYIKKCYNQIKNNYENLTDLELAERMLFSDDEIINRINYEEFERELISLLNEEETELYKLRFIEERRVKDIALMLGISERYCSMKITRLRRKIISSLKEYY